MDDFVGIRAKDLMENLSALKAEKEGFVDQIDELGLSKHDGIVASNFLKALRDYDITCERMIEVIRDLDKERGLNEEVSQLLIDTEHACDRLMEVQDHIEGFLKHRPSEGMGAKLGNISADRDCDSVENYEKKSDKQGKSSIHSKIDESSLVQAAGLGRGLSTHTSIESQTRGPDEAELPTDQVLSDIRSHTSDSGKGENEPGTSESFVSDLKEYTSGQGEKVEHGSLPSSVHGKISKAEDRPSFAQGA